MSRNNRALLLLLAVFVASCSFPWLSEEPTQNTSTKKEHKPIKASGGYAPPKEVALAMRTTSPGQLPEEPLSLYGNPPSYVALGVRYHVLDSADGYVEQGLASWYGPNFHGRETSNKEIFDMYKLSAAHKTLPLPSWVEVTHLESGKSIILRVNDRGPFKEGRIIDLSYKAAKVLGVAKAGVAEVEVRTLQGPSDTAVGQHRIYLQLAAFGERDNAVDFYETLKSRGAKKLSVRHGTRDDDLYRVLHGPLHNARQIKQAEVQLRSLGVTKVTPISLPPRTP